MSLIALSDKLGVLFDECVMPLESFLKLIETLVCALLPILQYGNPPLDVGNHRVVSIYSVDVEDISRTWSDLHTIRLCLARSGVVHGWGSHCRWLPQMLLSPGWWD